MPEQNQDSENTKTIERSKKRICLAVVFVVLIAIITCYIWSTWNSKSIEQQLAKIEAARAIPDSENAASVYVGLLRACDGTPMTPDFLNEKTYSIVTRQPWTGKDYPELLQWLKGHEVTIEKLMEASRFDKCCFEIGDYREAQMVARSNRLYTMHKWAYLLAIAVNNDMAEGRTDAAIDKYRSLIQLGRHICQQPVVVEYLFGIPFEGMALEGLQRLIIQTDLTESQLRIIGELTISTGNNWAEDSAEMFEVERLLRKQSISPLERLKEVWDGTSIVDLYENVEQIYLHTIATRRAFKILIALRYYKNTHGRWPETLDEVKSLAPPEIFVDPIAEDSFVYRLADDTFRLYSKGKNKIDEDGQWNVTFDPNTNEFMEHEDDRLFWPQKIPGKKENSTDGK